MQSISVSLPQNSYQIAIAAGSLPYLGSRLRELNIGKKVLLISNPEIDEYYGEITLKSLQQEGFEVITHLIPAGESYKNLESITHIYDIALENYLERSSTMIALGGGVIGDMTGFAAASWLRGINFIQVPTSLLAMVDASIGGKTGVNHPKGKNLIGAFYQPKLVFIDPQVLTTLPEREFRAGMAEVIKYGVIWDQELFRELETASRLDSLDYISQELLQTMIIHSCQAKAEIVTQDEFEASLRAILNYGHTLGHAIESLTNYNTVNHGEAVAIGMVLAGEIALKLGMWSQEELDRQNQLIIKAGLPTELPKNLAINDILETLKSDKKVKAGQIRFILPNKIGSAVVSNQVTSELIREILTDKFKNN